MTDQEKLEWSSIATEAAARQFIELWWARRDPTPSTPENEFHAEIEARIKEADGRFGGNGIRGSLTDRGKAFVLFGRPAEIQSHSTGNPRPVSSPAATSRTDAESIDARFSALSNNRMTQMELWIYRGDTAALMGAPKTRQVQLLFVAAYNTGDFRSQMPEIFNTAQQNIIRASLTQPHVLYANIAQPKKPVAPTPMLSLGLIVVKDADLAADLLKRIQSGANFADLARQYSVHQSSSQGGRIGRVAVGDLSLDFNAALVGAQPGDAVLIIRNPHEHVIIKVFPDLEASPEHDVKK
jgi:GWxTD domain-containing protein